MTHGLNFSRALSAEATRLHSLFPATQRAHSGEGLEPDAAARHSSYLRRLIRTRSKEVV